MTSTELVEKFQSFTKNLLIEIFPEKNVIISQNDQPWFTESLRTLKRKRQREYHKHGKSTKYFEIKAQFDKKVNDAILMYKNKILREVVEGKRGSSYSALRRLGDRPGDINSLEFQLPEYIEQGLTPQQSVEKMADYFSKISAEYLPLDISQLPIQIQHFLENEKTEDLGVLSK